MVLMTHLRRGPTGFPLHLLIIGLALTVGGCASEGESGSAPPLEDNGSAPAAVEQEAEPIFNGKDLTGWDGNPQLWSVQDGVIVGQTTPENPAEHNTFLIWEGDPVEDFTLTLDFRLTSGNSGVQYRSTVLNEDEWIVGGYQADMDAENRYTGMLYEEKGRGILARRGQKVVIEPDGTLDVVGTVGDSDSLAALIDTSGWNTYKIKAVGNHIVHWVNGHVTVDVTDNQAEKRAASGVIALQLHAGPPMKVEFRDIMLERLPSASAESP